MNPSSLTGHVTPIDAGAEVVGVFFLGDKPVLALASGEVLLGGIRARKFMRTGRS